MKLVSATLVSLICVGFAATGFNNVGVFGDSIFGLNAARARLATQCTVVADLRSPMGRRSWAPRSTVVT